MLVNQTRFHIFQELPLASSLFCSRLCSNSSKDVPEPTQAPFLEKEYGLNRMFKAFAPEKYRVPVIYKYNPFTVSQKQLKEWKDNTKRHYEIFGQRYIPKRHETLGSDLAAANFIVYRGGKVMFQGHDKWIEKKEKEEICLDLESPLLKKLYLERIDLSNTKIRYEGLVNMTNLKKLKWLSLRNCLHVDDWFLDKISGQYAETLEYLDISDCFNVTDNGLNGFYRFENLKKLVVHNIVRNVSFEFRCFLLEDTLPGLTIEGVKYLDVK